MHRAYRISAVLEAAHALDFADTPAHQLYGADERPRGCAGGGEDSALAVTISAAAIHQR
jgi:hypothetical protein